MLTVAPRNASRCNPRGLGLLTKLAGSWQWLEGDQETVLATVPTEYFAGAVAAASDADSSSNARRAAR